MREPEVLRVTLKERVPAAKAALAGSTALVSEEEIETVVRQKIAELRTPTMKDMGNVMKVLTPRLKGKAEGKAISEEVKAQLAKLGG